MLCALWWLFHGFIMLKMVARFFFFTLPDQQGLVKIWTFASGSRYNTIFLEKSAWNIISQSSFVLFCFPVARPLQ
jgi:hypothetical protein